MRRKANSRRLMWYNRYACLGILRGNFNAFPDTLSYPSARDKTKVCREERRYDSEWDERERGRNTEELRGEQGKEERESLCELAHNGNAKVNSLPGRKSTVGHLGYRKCILNVSQGLYVWIVYDILLAFLSSSSFRPGTSSFPRWCPLSFYSPSFSAASTRHYHHWVLTRRRRSVSGSLAEGENDK